MLAEIVSAHRHSPRTLYIMVIHSQQQQQRSLIHLWLLANELVKHLRVKSSIQLHVEPP